MIRFEQRVLAAVIALLGTGLSVRAETRVSIPVETWVVVLDDAVQADPERPAHAMRLVLRRGAGGWWPVLGDAPDYNKGVALGVVEATPAGDGLELRVILQGDAWVPGGIGRFRIPAAEGLPAAGGWTGSWRGEPGRGTVTTRAAEAGLSRMPVARTVPGPPRLFDEADARAALGELRSAGAHPVAIGLRRLAGDDQASTEQAWPAIAAAIADRNAGRGDERGYPWGERLRLLSLAWDLHAGSLDEDRERELRRWLADYGERALLRPWTISDRSYWAPDGRYVAQLRGAGALAALVLAGQPGPAPAAPDRPQDSILSIPASGAAQALPAQPIEPDRVASRWLMSGPHDADWVPDAKWIASLGSGEGIDAGAFRPVPDGGIVTDKARPNGSIDLARATGREADRGWLFVCALDVDHSLTGRWVLGAMNAAGRTWISGMEVADGMAIRLEPGRHVVAVRVGFRATPNAWDGLWMRPHIAAAEAATLDAAIAAGLEQHAVRAAVAGSAAVQHADTSGADTRWLDHLTLARLHAASWLQLCLGGGALPSEGDTLLWGSAAPMLEFEIFHRRVFGGGYADAGGGGALLERVAALAIGGERPSMPGFSIENSPIPPSIAIRAWAITAPERRAAALAALPAIDPAADPLGALLRAVNPPPAAAGVRPLGWVAPRRGAVFFRNRHRDGEDCVVGITANEALTGAHGQPEAGSWILHGLGRAWLTADVGNNSRLRPMEAVITHGDGVGAPSAPGRLLDHRLDTDGGGTALLDLSTTLAPLEADGYGRDPELVDRLGRFVAARFPKVAEGVVHRRAMAVGWTDDGALVLLRDRFRGAPGPGVWNLPTDAGAAVTIEGRGFVWKAGDAVLGGVLLGDGDGLRHGEEPVEGKFYERRRTIGVPAIRFDLPTAADAVVLLQLGRSPRVPAADRQGDRILVDGRHRFTLLADGGIRRE